MESDFDIFYTDIRGIFKAPKHRDYDLYFNQKLVSKFSDDALEGILSHELAHFTQYLEMSAWQLIKIGVEYILFEKSSRIIDFEKKTDLESIKRGYGLKLLQFRHELYKVLPPEKVKLKKEIYYTPSEIQDLIDVERFLKN